jgi:hypothetical protein
VHGQRASARAAAASRRPLSRATTNGAPVGACRRGAPFVVSATRPARVVHPLGYSRVQRSALARTCVGGVVVTDTVGLVLADGDGFEGSAGLIGLLLILLVLYLLFK